MDRLDTQTDDSDKLRRKEFEAYIEKVTTVKEASIEISVTEYADLTQRIQKALNLSTQESLGLLKCGSCGNELSYTEAMATVAKQQFSCTDCGQTKLLYVLSNPLADKETDYAEDLLVYWRAKAMDLWENGEFVKYIKNNEWYCDWCKQKLPRYDGFGENDGTLTCFSCQHSREEIVIQLEKNSGFYGGRELEKATTWKQQNPEQFEELKQTIKDFVGRRISAND